MSALGARLGPLSDPNDVVLLAVLGFVFVVTVVAVWYLHSS